MNDWLKHLEARQAALRAEGLARELRVADGAGVRLTMRGREVISFGSNDYLGLSTHPRVIAVAKAALDRFGSGATASALICGNKAIHDELAQALAHFKGTESALIFPSGFHAALASMGSLADEGATILLDKLSHASLIDGARLSFARMRSFAHNDVQELETLLKKENARRCMVVIESLYSMDGDIAPIDEIVGLCSASGALLLVDEAHATGVLGERGRGLVQPQRTQRTLRNGGGGKKGGGKGAEIIVMGTLSKALGAQGGFVCGAKALVDAMVMGRAHLFSTGLAPASAAAALEALKLIDDEPERREKLAAHGAFVRGELKRLKIETPSTIGPIVAAIIGDEKEALAKSEKLFERELFVPAVRYPTVKKGAARLRISLSAAHSTADCEKLIAALTDV